ncbi:hypothetical protein D3C86_1924430 [compost metagenome]
MIRIAELFATLDEIRSGKNRINQLSSLEIGDAVSDNNALITPSIVRANDARFAHAAIGVAVGITRIRPENLDSFSFERAGIAINMLLRNIELAQQRVNKEINAAACD